MNLFIIWSSLFFKLVIFARLSILFVQTLSFGIACIFLLILINFGIFWIWFKNSRFIRLIFEILIFLLRNLQGLLIFLFLSQKPLLGKSALLRSRQWMLFPGHSLPIRSHYSVIFIQGLILEISFIWVFIAILSIFLITAHRILILQIGFIHFSIFQIISGIRSWLGSFGWILRQSTGSSRLTTIGGLLHWCHLLEHFELQKILV